MLQIKVGEEEFYNEESEKFEFDGGTELRLEHSLVSLSKWEEIWEKPFLSKDEKSEEEILSYINCMSLNGDLPLEVILNLSAASWKEIQAYMDKKATATWFREDRPASPSREVVTSELIYYWLVAFQIPFEVETWHLNRLLTLIKICNIKQEKPEKMSPARAARHRRELNAQRRAQMGTRG